MADKTTLSREIVKEAQALRDQLRYWNEIPEVLEPLLYSVDEYERALNAEADLEATRGR